MFFVSLAKSLTGLSSCLVVHIFFSLFLRPLNELAPYFTGTHNLEGKKKKKSAGPGASPRTNLLSQNCVCVCGSHCLSAGVGTG